MRDPVDWPTVDLLTHRAGTTPERTAMVDAADGETWTYRELDAAADSTAAALDSALDAGPADVRVATLLDTRPAVGRLLFGTMRLGATLAPLNVGLDAGTLRAQLRALGADLLVCERATERLAAEVADCPVVSVDDTESTGVTELARRADTGAVDPVRLARDGTALVLFTSGTTSDPKGVRLTLGNLVASATASAFRLGVVPTDRWLLTLPTYHMGGLAPLVRSMLYGTAVVVQRSFDPERTAAAMADHDVTGVSLVPTMLKRLLDTGWEPPASLRFVLLGGGPASPELIERCADRGVPACPTYGMTETASQIATALPETAVEHAGTVGQPLVNTEVTVLSDGDPADPGERGELVVSGPTVTPGYLDDEQTAAAFGDDGFHTGDIGYRDEDGRLWVVGRVDDRIVTGGENVAASAVAAAIRDYQGVADAAVVGLPDAEWGQRVAALVVGDADRETVLAHCRAELAAHEVPKTVAFANELPRTASGTVDREAVRERLQ